MRKHIRTAFAVIIAIVAALVIMMAWLTAVIPDIYLGAFASGIMAMVMVYASRRDRVIVYIDMDGVLAKWTAALPEETMEKGFFLRLEPDRRMIQAMRLLQEAGAEVHILSAVYPNGHAEKEKRMWMNIHGVRDKRPVFIPYGKNKADYVHGGILVDDLSRNLHSWEAAGYTGIKYYNGVNGTKGTWQGAYVTKDMSAKEIARTILRYV